MPRRNIVPLTLLVVLAALTGLFAAWAAGSSPDSSSLVVQNATGETFGYPDGASSFSLHLVATAAADVGGTTITQVRLVDFAGPDHMAVYQTGASLRLLAVLDQSAIQCTLDAYTAIVGGTTPWAFGRNTTSGSTYHRTESLATYAARVPRAVGATCAPQETVVRGTVSESATVRSRFLVTLRVIVVVPPQTFEGGALAAHGVDGETLQLLQINRTPVASLS